MLPGLPEQPLGQPGPPGGTPASPWALASLADMLAARIQGRKGNGKSWVRVLFFIEVQLTYSILLVQGYSTPIQHLRVSCTDHLGTCSYHLSPYKAPTVLFTLFPVLCITRP